MAKAPVTINVAGAIGSVAEAITALTNAIAKYVGSSSVRRMVKCIRNADKIVERVKSFDLEDKTLDKLIKRHEKLNN